MMRNALAIALTAALAATVFAEEPTPTTIKTKHLSATVRADLGGRLVSLTDAAGRELLYADRKWEKLHRQLGLGENFLAYGGGMFDLVNPADGRTSYPGLVQCVKYEVKEEKMQAGPAVIASLKRGSLQIERTMALADAGPWMEVSVSYRNTGEQPLTTAPHLRLELAQGKQPATWVTRDGDGFRFGNVAVLEGGPGFAYARPSGGGAAVVVLYDPADNGLHYTWPMKDFDLVSLAGKPVELAPGAQVRARYLVALVAGPDDLAALAPAARPVLGKAVDAVLGDVGLVVANIDAIEAACGKTPQSNRSFRRFLLNQNFVLAWTWPGENHRGRSPYISGDQPARVTFTCNPLGQAKPAIRATLNVRTPGKPAQAEASIEAGDSSAVEIAAAHIPAGVWPATLVLTWDGGRASFDETIRRVDLADAAFRARLAELEQRVARLRGMRDKLKHYDLAMPWVHRCRETILSLAEGGELNWEPFVNYDGHQIMFEAADGFLDFALRVCRRIEADEDPRVELRGDCYLGYDMAAEGKPGGREYAKISAEPVAARAARLRARADELLAAGDAASRQAGNVLRAWAIFGQLASEYGTAANAGEDATKFWTEFLDAKLALTDAEVARIGKVDGRWVLANVYTPYLKHLERYRGYRVVVPPGYDPARRWPVIIHPHGSGGTEHSATGRHPWSTLGLIPQAARRGYIVVGVSQGGKYERGGATANGDVNRVLAELGGLLNIDPDRVYCAGGSLGADCTGNLANDLHDTWAACFPYSQGQQIFTAKTADLPFVSAQAYNYETVVLTGYARKWRDAGHYNPAIHYLMCYPGVGHTGMALDIWPFVLDFFDHHRRPARGGEGETKSAND